MMTIYLWLMVFGSVHHTHTHTRTHIQAFFSGTYMYIIWVHCIGQASDWQSSTQIEKGHLYKSEIPVNNTYAHLKQAVFRLRMCGTLTTRTHAHLYTYTIYSVSDKFREHRSKAAAEACCTGLDTEKKYAEVVRSWPTPAVPVLLSR